MGGWAVVKTEPDNEPKANPWAVVKTESAKPPLPGSTARLRKAAGAPEHDALEGSTARLREQTGAPDIPEDPRARFGKIITGKVLPAAGETVKGMVTGVLPQNLPEAAFGLANPPAYLTKKMYVDPAIEMGKRAIAAPTVAEKVGYGAAAALPLLGPAAADIGEELGRGEVGRAIGKVGAMAAMGAVVPGAKAAKGVYEGTGFAKGRATRYQAKAQIAAEEAAFSVPEPVQKITNSLLGPTARNPGFERTFGDVADLLVDRLGGPEVIKTTGVTAARAARETRAIAKAEGAKFRALAADDMANPIPAEQFQPIRDLIAERTNNPVISVDEAAVTKIRNLEKVLDEPHTVDTLNKIQRAMNDELYQSFHRDPRGVDVLATDPFVRTARDVRKMIADIVYNNLSDPRAKKAYQLSGKAGEVATELTQTAVLARRAVENKTMLPSPWEGAGAMVGTATKNPLVWGWVAGRYLTRRLVGVRNRMVDHPDYVLSEQLPKLKPGVKIPLEEIRPLPPRGGPPGGPGVSAGTPSGTPPVLPAALPQLPEAPASTLIGPQGKGATIYHPGGENRAQFRVVEADQLIPSHDPVTFAKDTRYPEGIQERQYQQNKDAQAQTIRYSAEEKWALFVEPDPGPANGPPMVLPNGVVLGGNGRTMALVRTYREGRGESYKKYVMDRAAQFGLNPEEVGKMRRPVLIREILDAAPGAEAQRLLGRNLNGDLTKALASYEEAVSAGKNLTPESANAIAKVLDDIGEGATLRDAMNKDPMAFRDILLRDGVIREEKLKKYFDDAGELNEVGKEFIENALTGAVVNNAELLSRMPKALIQKVERAVPSLVELATRNDAWNIVQDFRSAVALISSAAARKVAVIDFLNQIPLGATRPPFKESVRLIALKLTEKPTEVTKAFRRYAGESRLDSATSASLLGRPDPVESFREIFSPELKQLPAPAPMTYARAIAEYRAALASGETTAAEAVLEAARTAGLNGIGIIRAAKGRRAP